MMRIVFGLLNLAALASAQITCADINGDGTADVTCAADPCTPTECCTVAPPPARTCADINADGTADDPFDCSGEANDISATPAGITCAADPCTPTECCTVAASGGGR